MSAIAQDVVTDPKFVIHLLDYLAKDYGGAVEDGKIKSQFEYDEQVEFSKSVLLSAQRNPEIANDTKLVALLKELKESLPRKEIRRNAQR